MMASAEMSSTASISSARKRRLSTLTEESDEEAT